MSFTVGKFVICWNVHDPNLRRTFQHEFDTYEEAEAQALILSKRQAEQRPEAPNGFIVLQIQGAVFTTVNDRTKQDVRF